MSIALCKWADACGNVRMYTIVLNHRQAFRCCWWWSLKESLRLEKCLFFSRKRLGYIPCNCSKPSGSVDMYSSSGNIFAAVLSVEAWWPKNSLCLLKCISINSSRWGVSAFPYVVAAPKGEKNGNEFFERLGDFVQTSKVAPSVEIAHVLDICWRLGELHSRPSM
jgi:hypothetical protein